MHDPFDTMRAVAIEAKLILYVATDLNNHSGWRTPQQVAQVVVRLASLSSDGPSGGFFDENGVVPW